MFPPKWPQKQPSSCDGGGGGLLDAYTRTQYSSPSPHSEIHVFCHCLLIRCRTSKIFSTSSLQSNVYLYLRRKLSASSFEWCHFLLVHSLYAEVTLLLFFHTNFHWTKIQRHYTCTALICKIQIPAGRPYNGTNCFPVVTQSHSRERAVSFKRSIFRNHYLKPCWNTTLPSVGTLGS